MKRIALISLLILCFTQVASAQEWAKATLEKSPRHREWVTVKHDGRSVETFVVYPESKSKTPVVVIIHDIFGMTDWVQDLADQVAAAGYIAVAPDLLSGMGPSGGRSSDFAEGKSMEAVSHLNPDQVTADLNAAAEYALKIPASNGKLFVGGFCWGGGQTFRFATNRADLAGAFVFYGPPPDRDAMVRIKAPVYGFYAGNDARIGAMIPDAVVRHDVVGLAGGLHLRDGIGDHRANARVIYGVQAVDRRLDSRHRVFVRRRAVGNQRGCQIGAICGKAEGLAAAPAKAADEELAV